MRVKERPNELAADIFEAKFECSVLENGVVAAIEGCRAYVETLLVSDFFGRNEMVGVTGACGRNGGVKWMAEEITESDSWWGGLNGFCGAGALKHSRLCGHDGTLFYTVAKQRHRREKHVEKCFSRMDSEQEEIYFFAAVCALAYFFWKRSTRPAVSTSFCLPVKNGWQLEQISTRNMSPLVVERVWKVLPQAQCTVTAW